MVHLVSEDGSAHAAQCVREVNIEQSLQISVHSNFNVVLHVVSENEPEQAAQWLSMVQLQPSSGIAQSTPGTAAA